MEKNLKAMDDSQKIIYIIKEVFGATSFKKGGVTLEQVINKGIELGITQDWPRGGKDGHPWYPHTADMMGKGTENQEVWELHRKKGKSNKDTTAFIYIVDENTPHKSERELTEEQKRVRKMEKERIKAMEDIKMNQYKGRTIGSIGQSPIPTDLAGVLTAEEKFSICEEKCPGTYLLVNGRILQKSWVLNHIDKFKTLYGGWVENHQQEFDALCQLSQTQEG